MATDTTSVRLPREHHHRIRAVARALREQPAFADKIDQLLAGGAPVPTLSPQEARPKLLASASGYLGVSPDYRPQKYPMWVNGTTVANEAEEAIARAKAPPPTPGAPAPAPKGDWERAGLALAENARHEREAAQEKQIRDANFTGAR